METMFICELFPADGRKSFYGKAKVIKYGNSFDLVSYHTTVSRYDMETGEFTRLWNGYSATTMRHVNSFMRFLGYDYGGKAWWDSLPIGVPVKL